MASIDITIPAKVIKREIPKLEIDFTKKYSNFETITGKEIDSFNVRLKNVLGRDDISKSDADSFLKVLNAIIAEGTGTDIKDLDENPFDTTDPDLSI